MEGKRLLTSSKKKWLITGIIVTIVTFVTGLTDKEMSLEDL